MKKSKKPVFIPIICCWCGQISAARKDKFSRPYVVCPGCGSRHFFKTPLAEVGYELVCDMIRNNLDWYNTELQRRYTERMALIQSGLLEDQTAKRKARMSHDPAKIRAKTPR